VNVRSCTIITTEANTLVAPIHDRMPVIVGAEEWAKWLGEASLDDPATLLKPFPAERMTLWPVSKAVGNVKNQGPELAERVVLA
jgi:putative SOS response-associated peptidase YedK